jgi:hypothetical protein
MPPQFYIMKQYPVCLVVIPPQNYDYPVCVSKGFFLSCTIMQLKELMSSISEQFRRTAGSGEGATCRKSERDGEQDRKLGTHLDSEGPHREDVWRVHAVEVGLHLWDPGPAGRRRYERRYR